MRQRRSEKNRAKTSDPNGWRHDARAHDAIDDDDGENDDDSDGMDDEGIEAWVIYILSKSRISE